MLSKMINSRAPTIHHGPAETTPGPNLGRGNLPRIHEAGLEFHIMHEIEMLSQMILPVKGTFRQGPLCAG